MSVDPSGHSTHIALDHCESRPSPHAPVFDLWLPNRTVVGVSARTPMALRRIFTEAATEAAWLSI